MEKVKQFLVMMLCVGQRAGSSVGTVLTIGLMSIAQSFIGRCMRTLTGDVIDRGITRLLC